VSLSELEGGHCPHCLTRSTSAKACLGFLNRFSRKYSDSTADCTRLTLKFEKCKASKHRLDLRSSLPEHYWHRVFKLVKIWTNSFCWRNSK